MSNTASSGRLIGAIDQIAKYSGVLRRMRRANAKGVTILMYHKVLPRHLATRYPWRNLVVDAEVFDAQMRWLAGHFEVLPIRDAVMLTDGGLQRTGRTGRPLACVTFDDGYLDNYDHAAPILEALGLRATFFVATDFVCGTAFWFDRAALSWLADSRSALREATRAAPEQADKFVGVSNLDAWIGILKRMPTRARDAVLAAIDAPSNASVDIYGAMTPMQVRELAERGHEVGAHSVTHRMLTQLDDATLRVELEQPRTTLTEWTGVPIESVCYPNGDHDDRVIAAAKSAGYRYGCAVTRGIVAASSNPLALPRRAIFSSDRGNPKLEFEAEVVGWHDWLRNLRRGASFVRGRTS
jgi:peptidoglycan/xylan/chitin deacetylase (PgdA/CDA1 family)